MVWKRHRNWSQATSITYNGPITAWTWFLKILKLVKNISFNRKGSSLPNSMETCFLIFIISVGSLEHIIYLFIKEREQNRALIYITRWSVTLDDLVTIPKGADMMNGSHDTLLPRIMKYVHTKHAPVAVLWMTCTRWSFVCSSLHTHECREKKRSPGNWWQLTTCIK